MRNINFYTSQINFGANLYRLCQTASGQPAQVHAAQWSCSAEDFFTLCPSIDPSTLQAGNHDAVGLA